MIKPAKNVVSRKWVRQLVIAGFLILCIVAGFSFGAQLALRTNILPAVAVSSATMCTEETSSCGSWTHAFERTVHIGDLVIIQGVNPQELATSYPNSDVIAFHKPGENKLVISRIAASEYVNETLFFFTRGDGENTQKVWPEASDSFEYDSWVRVNESLVEGKVVARIPVIGYIGIWLNDAFGAGGCFMIAPVTLILLLFFVCVEVAANLLKRRAAVVEQKLQVEKRQMHL